MNLLIPIFSPPTGTWGSLTRVMAIANKFKNEGHSVAFCASGYVKDVLKEKGYLTYEIPETTIFGLPKFFSDIISKRSQKITPPKSIGNIWLLYTLTGYGKQLHKIVKAEINAVNNFNPDILILSKMRKNKKQIITK